MKKTTRLHLAAPFGILVVLCGAEGAFGQGVEPEESPAVRVLLNRFSGMPNPYFEISTSEDLATLRDLIAGVPEIERPEHLPTFGGFTLNADEGRTRFPAYVTVVSGVIVLNTADGSERVLEDAKGLEDFLRDKAIEAGLGEHL